jgi:hypothetical protein
MGSNPIPFTLRDFPSYEKNIEATSVLIGHLITILIIINYKNKNPQAYLMGSSPTPHLILGVNVKFLIINKIRKNRNTIYRGKLVMFLNKGQNFWFQLMYVSL